MNTCEAYDRRNNTWTYLPPLKEGRYSHSVIEYEDGKLYAIGGISKQQKLISSIEVLDKEHTVWTKLTIEIPIAIAYPAVIPIEGDMLIIAGGWIKDT
jgi:N-acetylneuraminic acid mutarotase